MQVLMLVFLGIVTLFAFLSAMSKILGSDFQRYALTDIGLPSRLVYVAAMAELAGVTLLVLGFWSKVYAAIGLLIIAAVILCSLVGSLFRNRGKGWVANLVALMGVTGLLYVHRPSIDDIVKFTMTVEMGPEKPVSARTFAEFPDDTPALFESIVVMPEGHFFVTIGNKGIVRRVNSDGSWENIATLPTGEYGVRRFEGVIGTLVAGLDGQLYATLVALDPKNRGVWKIDPETGDASLFSRLDAEAQPNGITIDQNGDFFVADSHLSLIWKIDGESGTATRWLESELFGRTNRHAAPGVNGVKLFDQALYATNSFTGNVIRVPIEADGTAGEAAIIAEGLPSDDLAFDEAGNMYITTHIFNTIVRLSPGGTKEVIGRAEDGIIGPTDVAFGVTHEDRDVLYVINDGGFVLPAEGYPEVPSILALDVGREGKMIP